MKNVFLTSFLFVAAIGMAKDLPEAVKQSFNKRFPQQAITSWNDNSDYDYEGDWADDIYYGDYDFDGYGDYGYGYGYPGYGYPYGDYAFGYPAYEYAVPMDYNETYTEPTYYQLNFTMDDIKMTAMFKPDGTFVIAKGHANNIPAAVTKAIQGKFKGKTVKFGHDEEKMIVPNDKVPVYRIKVEIKHAKNHIIKVDENGKVISDQEK